ncbi:Dyp-type peroxidase domain-containing protein [Paraflavitalea sp. CAU 1676]|uniref:Dyp-type peroxidase n=1 Tax=Paraflavitalea sp. CAU 1676 TaxID=3032598 RepID=UPI0023D99B3A|nr:Dyp-type peroxidase domain-containing protein [Paraflavitalea sp. CAU 1676]MDF2193705.1 Dyp-type peroxidase [Paraflavitalea sp. CAU 1676]
MKLIDPMDFSDDPLLSKLQGNILKGHGRDLTAHLFLRFYKSKEKAARAWIRTELAPQLTSFKKQLFERERYNRNAVKGGMFTAFFITAAGYRALDYENVDVMLTDQGFLKGMKGRREKINDPVKEQWEKGYQGEIHAMVLLADDDAARLIRGIRDIIDSVTGIADIATMENGNVLRNENDDGIEHFGYVDGISQPLFLKDEVERYMKSHRTDAGNAHFNPAADIFEVLHKDPYAEDQEAYGSYFVFRKLEQNVKGFKEAEEALDLGELGGAYLVGRFEDGSPVRLTDDEGMIGGGMYNNFNYGKTDLEQKESSTRCPYFAHIRKTNSRRNTPKTPLIARRGIPYGTKGKVKDSEHDTDSFPEKGVGLLFMCYQVSIEKQFEEVQRLANDYTTSGTSKLGIDAIIGQPAADASDAFKYEFPFQYGQNGQVRKGTFNQFVTLKGGEYFFAPSIPFLKKLKP